MAVPDITAEITAFREAAYGEDVRSALIQLAQKLRGVITSELTDMSQTWNSYKTGMDNDWSDLQDTWNTYKDDMDDDWSDFKTDIETDITNIQNLAILNKHADRNGVTDANDLLDGLVYVSNNTVPSNFPTEFMDVGYILTISLNNTNKIQIGYNAYGSSFCMRGLVNNTWNPWNGYTIDELRNIINNAFINRKNSFGNVTDANDLPDGIVYASQNTVPSNFPTKFMGAGYIFTVSLNNTNKIQIGYNAYGSSFCMRGLVNNTWNPWNGYTIDELRNIINNAFINRKNSFGNVTDANDLPDGIVYASRNTVPSNFPTEFIGAGYIFTISLNNTNKIQIGYNAYGSSFCMRGLVNNTWNPWRGCSISDLYYIIKLKPDIDSYVVSSSLSMFSKIACIGDSFTAGYLYNKTDSDWYDPNYVPNGAYSEISWPRVLGRLYGTDIALYAVPGITTGGFVESVLPTLMSDDPSQLYILCLGLNDRTKQVPIGVESDLDTAPSTPTFLGNYGQIIRSIRSKAPLSKLIICKSFWVYGENSSTPNVYYTYISQGVEIISNHFGIPFIETLNDPYFSSNFYKNGFKGLHPTAPLYAGLAKRLGQLIDKCIINNPNYFFNYYPESL